MATPGYERQDVREAQSDLALLAELDTPRLSDRHGVHEGMGRDVSRRKDSDDGHSKEIEMITMFRVLAAVFAVWSLTGCATIRAQKAEQARWQAMADQVTTHYRVPSIYVRPVASPNGQYRCQEHAINLGTDATPWLLAHELGHYVLGHGCAEGLALEEAANAFAVEAMQVWGTSQPDAVRTTVGILVYAQRRHVSLPWHDWCAEAADVLRRYPTHGMWRG